jgi:predicted glycoside hydrolase/deacetylase ChbG (UPF0249 family)
MNNTNSGLRAVLGFIFIAGIFLGQATAQEKQPIQEGAIRLIVRADDIGSSHAANVACIQSYREGIARSVEIMVPAPWFNEAVTMLKQNPNYDVGVHLTLTSEWDNLKWGPLTRAPSLVDAQGHFYPATTQRKGFPPNTGFLQGKPKLAEVEKELRAQIELAKKKIPQVSHLSSHMGTPTCTPELRKLVEKLAREYKLPIATPGVQGVRGFYTNKKKGMDHEAALVKTLEDLTPGTWLLVEHPGLDTPEMRAIGHKGYEDVAKDRAGVTKAFTSDKVKQVIARRGIQLIRYADLYKKQASIGK